MHPQGGQRDGQHRGKCMETRPADDYAVHTVASATIRDGRIFVADQPGLEWEMTYFVTGATGFIGRHLLEKLLLRKGRIY